MRWGAFSIFSYSTRVQVAVAEGTMELRPKKAGGPGLVSGPGVPDPISLIPFYGPFWTSTHMLLQEWSGREPKGPPSPGLAEGPGMPWSEQLAFYEWLFYTSLTFYTTHWMWKHLLSGAKAAGDLYDQAHFWWKLML